ncbi:MAG: BREX system P-loop protein BrxC [Deltaproteobacteria bacterium]|nr:BREX system P-loop protein BrxC [Deltaproteobacteria bacterium]
MVEFLDALQERSDGKTARLVFIIDEMGQFIGDDSQKLLELQSIVEQFAVKGKGKLWLIVTAQERLDEIIEGVKQKRADFVKIGDRFHSKLELTSENIEKVIEERMLKKRETHKPSLLSYYKEHAGAIGNIATLQDANRQLPTCDADNFLKTYPLMPAQLDIIPDIFRALRSAGQRFTPLSGSERSLLGVVQSVIIDDRTNIKNADIGRIATYDEIYDMVEHEIDTQVRRDIAEVERLLHYPDFSLRRILKALYLIQQLTWVPRSLDNLTRLLMRNIDEDFNQTRSVVEGGLEQLIEGKYVVKVDNQYKYLSGDERKIEEEIAAFKPKHNDIRREARKILLGLSNRFTDIHYKKLAHIPIVALADEESVDAKKAGDVTLEIYSPIAVEFGDAGRPEIKNQSYSDACKIWWLPNEDAGTNLIKEFTRLIQVDTVVEARNKKTTKSEEEIAILREKQIEADSLRKRVESGFRAALANGVIIYNGEDTPLDGSAKDLNTIFARELNDILPHIYTKFDFVTHQVNEKSVVELLSQPTQNLYNIESHLLLFDEAGNIQLHSPVLNEVLTEVKGRTQSGKECDGRSLLEHFRKAPYGWDGNVTRVALSALFRSGDILIKFEGKDFQNYTQRAAKDALRTLTNFNKTEFIYQDTSLTLQERIEAKKRLDILFSYKGTDTANELSNAIVLSLGDLAAENKNTAVHCQYAQLPLKDEYERLRQLCEEIIEGANVASRVRVFLEHYDELETGQKYQQRVKEFVESEKLNVFESVNKFMALDDKGEVSDEGMPLALEEINAVLANRTVISSWDVLVQNYTQVLSLYRKAYTQSHQERFSAYQKAEQEIRSSDEAQRAESEKVDEALKNWDTYLCENLDWDETLFRCRECGAPLSTVNFHLKLVETNKQEVLKELRSLIRDGDGNGYHPGDTKYTSLKEFVTKKEVQTEEEIEKLVAEIRDGLVQLLSKYEKIVIP